MLVSVTQHSDLIFLSLETDCHDESSYNVAIQRHYIVIDHILHTARFTFRSLVFIVMLKYTQI